MKIIKPGRKKKKKNLMYIYKAQKTSEEKEGDREKGEGREEKMD